MKAKLFPLTVAIVLSSFSVHGNLLISGMVDGTQSGGIPKAMEVVAETNIPDLSDYWIARNTNGDGNGLDDFFQLPSVSLNTNDFFYIYGSTTTTTSMTTLGFPTTAGNAVQDGILNWNGDDVFALVTPNGTFTTGTNLSEFDLVDGFGQESQGDTNFAENSISYRPNNTPANPHGVADAGNFVITAYSDSALQSTFGTYVIPEPSIFGLVLAGFLATFHLSKRYNSAKKITNL